jgi:hypothetical protein
MHPRADERHELPVEEQPVIPMPKSPESIAQRNLPDRRAALPPVISSGTRAVSVSGISVEGTWKIRI